MTDPTPHLDAPALRGGSGPSLFSPPPAEPPQRGLLLGVLAGVAVLVLVAAGLFFFERQRAEPVAQNSLLPLDLYAQSVSFTQLAMSQSTSLSGGTSTFIDGNVRNSGPETLTGIRMQVVFRNDVGLSPQVETLPLSLIRMHEPYIDTEPVSAAPLKPGDEAEFRLIFESVPGNWNQQMPELRVVGVTKK